MIKQQHFQVYQLIEDDLLDVVSSLERKGRFKIFRNNFSCILVDDAYSYAAESLLSPFGFAVPEKVRRRKSPRTHISILTSHELSEMSQDKVKKVRERWDGRG